MFAYIGRCVAIVQTASKHWQQSEITLTIFATESHLTLSHSDDSHSRYYVCISNIGINYINIDRLNNLIYKNLLTS